MIVNLQESYRLEKVHPTFLCVVYPRFIAILCTKICKSCFKFTMINNTEVKESASANLTIPTCELAHISLRKKKEKSFRDNSMK